MAFGLADRTEPLPRILERSLLSKLGEDAAPQISELLKAYGTHTSATTNSIDTVLPVMQFLTDIGFSEPALTFAKAWSQSRIPGTEAFLYHFNAPNPWDGPWKGHATHIFDIACLLQNYNEFLSPGQVACAERFAREIIRFAAGTNPWTPFESSAPAAMVYYAGMNAEKDASVFAPNGEPELTRRRHILETVIGKDRFDDLSDVMSTVLKGAH
jgi:carboxylesterase type B